jgi:DNA-binding SARP family transcriptional activator
LNTNGIFDSSSRHASSGLFFMRSPNEDPVKSAAGAAKSPALAINLISPFMILAGDKEIELTSRKTRALIGYLTLADSQEESRERLVGLLWSESTEERARASLRQTLHEIRNALNSSAFDGFRTDRLTVALDRTQIRVDVVDVLNDAARGRAHPRLLERQNPVDDILGEVETADPVFQTWVLAKRQTIHDQIIRQLENALRAQAGITPEARELATAINNLDQTHEEACRVLIRAFVADGEIGRALRIYKNCGICLKRITTSSQLSKRRILSWRRRQPCRSAVQLAQLRLRRCSHNRT